MTTLIELLLGYFHYSKEHAIYAKFVDGRFIPESPAVVANASRELTVDLDRDYIYFSRNDLVLDFMNEYSSSWLVLEDWSFDDWELVQDEINWNKAARYLIKTKNRVIAELTISIPSLEDNLKMLKDVMKLKTNMEDKELRDEFLKLSESCLNKIWLDEDKTWQDL